MISLNLKFLTLLVMLITSCDNKSPSLFEFDPRNVIEKDISLNEIADDIFYIPLDNIYPISLIYNYYFIDNSIYLSSKDIGIMIFSREGKMQKKIGTIGRGPGEYYRHTKFTVDNIKGTIYIQDSDNIIKVYSKNGEFLRNISFKEYSGNIDLAKFYSSRLFLFNYLQFGDSKYNWIIIDTLGNVIKTKERTLPIFWSNWGAESGTYFFKDDLIYWNSYNDTVYRITSDLNSETSFLISPGEYRLPQTQFDPQQKLSQYMLLKSIFETNKFWVIYYFFNKKKTMAIIEKKTRKSYMICWETSEYGGIINNLDGGTKFFPTYYYTENNREYMVGLIEPFQLKTQISSEEFINSTPKYPEKKKELIKLAESLNESDNPVLMLVRLKE